MKIIIAFISAVLLTVISSCSTCTICEKGSEPDVRICKQDYNNDEAYRKAITDKESDLFRCNN